MSQAIVVQTTTDSSANAEKLAETIVQNAQGACVQIVGPIKSVYKWQETIQKEEEFLVSIKTTRPFFSSLAELIRQHHKYEVPEIIALPIIDGSSEYLEWVANQVHN
ncbi:divalent-cation tolerance protein CutA [Bremerella alba]|uniref:Divalent-cation tolerance protein CutA n=1 Tax=Bremerella alba TaxID=980252 RepID=A0A7V8V916_9BACT|nr:divalent-cation tolerance protein CutA [Bremerella alba]MBA2117153.1 Divalent-cation tolerance protein CutA [Bremerella alba]